MMRLVARTARHSSKTSLSPKGGVTKTCMFCHTAFLHLLSHETPKASLKGGFLEVFGVVEKDL